jgi:hypothetical protein
LPFPLAKLNAVVTGAPRSQRRFDKAPLGFSPLPTLQCHLRINTCPT